MRINELTEAPMGILQKLGHKVMSKIPGSIGATSQGKLETGEVANSLKNQYMTWLAASGQQPTAKTIMAFFTKRKKYNPQLIGRALASLKGMSEATNRVYTRRELDQIILNIAQGAIAGDFGKSIQRSKPKPDLIQRIQTGFTKNAAPKTGTSQSSTDNQPGIIDKVKGAFTKQQPKQKIEPTFDTPASVDDKQPTPKSPPKYVPSRRAPKPVKKITKYKED